MVDGPSVFGSGEVTVAISQTGMSVWVSQTRVDYVKSFEFSHEAEKGNTLIISFYESHDQETALQIEENVRIARTIPWVVVRT
jgi:hypothetical protein